MTNFEFYKEEVNKITNEGHSVAIVNNKPVDCYPIDNCEVCDLLHDTVCSAGLVKWLYREYESHTDWSKIEVDTPILVSIDGNKWIRRHFARYVNGRVYFFQNGETSWTQTQNLELVSWKYAKLKEEE